MVYNCPVKMLVIPIVGKAVSMEIGSSKVVKVEKVQIEPAPVVRGLVKEVIVRERMLVIVFGLGLLIVILSVLLTALRDEHTPAQEVPVLTNWTSVAKSI